MTSRKRLQLVQWILRIGIGVWLGLFVLMMVVSDKPSPVWMLPFGVLLVLFGCAHIYFRIEFAELYEEHRERYFGAIRAFVFAPAPEFLVFLGILALLLGIGSIVVAVLSIVV